MENKRINVRLKNPNPLFKKWLQEIIDDAKKRQKKIGKAYQNALDSLNKYPLTLHSGHDCAILENFGPKICQLLDEKLEKHLAERLDLFQFQSYKDKVSEVQRRENIRISDLIRSVEAACLIDNTFNENAVLKVIEEEDELENVSSEKIVLTPVAMPVADEVDDLVSLSDEIPEELLSSSAESEDSLDRLIRKYDPDAAQKRKKLKRPHAECENVIKRAKKLSQIKEVEVVDLSQSPVSATRAVPFSFSPTSTVARGGVKLKRFKTFDNIKNNVAGPSYASSPISNFLDVETTSSPASKKDYDEFDNLVSKYDFPSPIPVVAKKVPTRLIKKPSNSKLKIAEVPAQPDVVSTQLIPEEVEDDFEYISVDDINPSDFNVILLVDTQETSGNRKASNDELIVRLNGSKVCNEVRKLHVGDFVWIAQHKTEKTKEFVLPYIIERKRLDDLSMSIKDGRFHEQKFRLKQSGIENAIYLIESHLQGGKKLQHRLPFTTLLQAATNTQIHSNFQVKFTESSQHTALYLTIMTSFIENLFNKRAPIKLKMMEFKKFNQSSVKQRRCTVRETFIKHLLALKGLSVDIALEITKHYPLPSHLIDKYNELGKSEGEKLLTKITIGDLKRKIPAPVSKSIYHFYMLDKL